MSFTGTRRPELNQLLSPDNSSVDIPRSWGNLRDFWACYTAQRAREHTFTDYQKPVSKTYRDDILWYLTSSSTSEATFSPVRIAKFFHLCHFRALK